LQEDRQENDKYDWHVNFTANTNSSVCEGRIIEKRKVVVRVPAIIITLFYPVPGILCLEWRRSDSASQLTSLSVEFLTSCEERAFMIESGSWIIDGKLSE
jgi:hypothetical protein